MYVCAVKATPPSRISMVSVIKRNLKVVRILRCITCITVVMNLFHLSDTQTQTYTHTQRYKCTTWTKTISRNLVHTLLVAVWLIHTYLVKVLAVIGE